MQKNLRSIIFCSLMLAGCTSTPKLDSSLIRPWDSALDNDFPGKSPGLAHYKKGQYELFYLAASHENSMDSETLRLVSQLFEKNKFDVLIIESIPNSSGESPKWFLEEAKKGQKENFIDGGEDAWGVILADRNKIPFFAGEPDHQEIYRSLRAVGYTDLDVIGFYVARQVPQWVRQREDKKGLIERMAPWFIKNNCKMMSIADCPDLAKIKTWYREKNGRELTVDITNNDVGPMREGKLFTQQISSAVGNVRDKFTLGVIESLLGKYKRVAVIYGAGHFITLRKSFDSSLGTPSLTKLAQSNQLKLSPKSIVEIQSVNTSEDPSFEQTIQHSIGEIIRFSKKHNLEIQNSSEFVTKVIRYGSKSDFDKMIQAAPDWPRNAPVPTTYVGVGQKSVFHVISWESYKLLRPKETAEDYQKLITHELSHLFHVAFLKGNEDRMGPMWFFEGFACLLANQYVEEKSIKRDVIAEAMRDPKRGNYRIYAAILRQLSAKKPIRYLLDHAADPDFPQVSESQLTAEKRR